MCSHGPLDDVAAMDGGVLLPLMYRQQQPARTRCPRRKAKMLQACKALQAQSETTHCTQKLAAGE